MLDIPQREYTCQDIYSLRDRALRSSAGTEVDITIYFTNRDPVGPYHLKVGARRTLHQRFNDLRDPEPIPRATPYASVITSNVPIVVQHTRLVRELLPLIEVKEDGAWRTELAETRSKAEAVDARRAQIEGDPINPERIFTELSPRLPDRCLVTGDAGTSTNWLARHLKMRDGMKFSLLGGLATMGSAVPYAIAAKFAFPDRVAIALTGDGAMQMNGLNERKGCRTFHTRPMRNRSASWGFVLTKSLATSLRKGDPEEVPVIVDQIKQLAAGLLPRKRP